MKYSSVDTTTGRRVIRSTDGRSTFPVLVLEISAAAKLATCVRMDGKGTGRPFVVEAWQFLEGAADADRAAAPFAADAHIAELDVRLDAIGARGIRRKS